MRKNPGEDDQNTLNSLIRQPAMNVKWKHFSADFLSGGTTVGGNGYRWYPGITFPIPETILLHHANWTVGVPNKIAQLQYVKAVVKKNREA